MKVLLQTWTDNLYEIFVKEVDLYKELLAIEIKKTDAVIKADGKAIESLVKKSYELMVAASELERSRMRSINEIYEKAHLEKTQGVPTLNDFLNQIDRDSNFKLKGIAGSLKESVNDLKIKILTNESLIKSRQDLFKKTIELLKSSDEDTLYKSDRVNTNKLVSKSVMVNTRA